MPPPPEPGGPAPESREPRSVPEPRSPEETLRRLEQRLDQASAAAERLIAQAAAEAARAGIQAASAGNPDGGGAGNPDAGAGNPGGGGAGNPDAGAGNPGGSGAGNPGAGDEPDPPPAGWQTAEDTSRGPTPELDPFVALVQAMRDLIPPDLQRRLIAALREVLLALRALIDWYLERLERKREQGVEVQDIPIL